MDDVVLRGVGDNQPNSLEALIDRVNELVSVANKWATERPEITDDTMAVKCNDFLVQVNAEIEAVEGERVRKKKPHLEAAKAVDDTYNPLKTLLEKVKAILGPRQRAWLKREQERLDKEREERGAAAKRARDEAEKAAQAASVMEGDVIRNQVNAEALAKKAEEAAKAVEQVPAKATVKGAYAERATTLRKVWKAELVNINSALLYYRNHPDLRELVVRLANAELRVIPAAQKAKFTILGFEIRQVDA